MALLKIKDFDPNYREVFGGYDVKGLDVYSDFNNEKIGDVDDLLVDEQGCFRYFIISLGFWAFGKKILLPVERSQVSSDGKHLYTVGLAKEQVETLPEFNESLRIDNDHRDKVSGVHAHPVTPGTMQAPIASYPLEQARPLEQHPQVGQVPPPIPQQAYPTPNQPVPPYPPAAQPYPVAPQPPMQPMAPQGQANFPPQPPVHQGGYQSNPPAQPVNGQPANVLQRFEDRLRNKRTLEQR